MSFFGCENQNNLDGSISLDLDTTIVDINGALRVMGNKIVNKHSQPISLAGNSFFGVITIGEVSGFIIQKSFLG